MHWEKQRKIALFIALIFFTLSFFGGIASYLFLAAFIGTICIAALAKPKEKVFIEALKEISVFFKKLVLPLLAIVFSTVIVISFFYLIFELEVSNVEQLPFTNLRIILTLLVLAAVIEELFFRWFIFSVFRWFNRKWEKIALVFSSALFGYAHTFGAEPVMAIGLFTATFIAGLILGRQFLKEGIVSAIWLHAIYNLFVGLLQYIIFWSSYAVI